MPPEKTIMDVANQTTDMTMPWNQLWRYALGAVVGGAGGCAIAAALKAKGVNITRWVAFSYAAIGSFATIFFLALFFMKGWINFTIEDIIVYGGASCMIVVGTISGVNITLHFSARKLAKDLTQIAGVKMDIDIDETRS